VPVRALRDYGSLVWQVRHEQRVLEEWTQVSEMYRSNDKHGGSW
jgi:hypothetical protein